MAPRFVVRMNSPLHAGTYSLYMYEFKFFDG